MAPKIRELNMYYLDNPHLLVPELTSKFKVDLSTRDKCIEYLESIEYLRYEIRSSYYHGCYVTIIAPSPVNNVDTIITKDAMNIYGPDSTTAIHIAMLLTVL